MIGKQILEIFGVLPQGFEQGVGAFEVGDSPSERYYLIE
jgi:hypothetical protein